MTQDRDIEREQVEEVFRLTGGELSDEHWAGFKYWYEGVPEYAGSDFTDRHESNVLYRTVVWFFVYSSPADTLEDDQGVWKLTKTYTSSGETECPGRHTDEDKIGKVDDEGCQLCGEDPGEEHGYLYLGEGWAEAVYRLELKDEEV